jgi:NADH dehydrogenase FAD-containing subunit
VERIEARQILCRRGDEEPRAIPADAVILAAGVRESRDLADALRAGGCEVHEIGDCGGVGYIEGAIHEGARVAREI